MDDNSNYCVDVIGFNPTERLLLQSIFGLATRRDPSFVQREPNSSRPVHLYLVDGDNDTAMNEFRAVHSRFPAPTVLVGAADRNTGLPLIPRPIQWARLLQCFDDAVLEGPQPPLAASGTGSTSGTSGTLRAVTVDPDRTPALRRTNGNTPALRQAPRARRATDAVLVVDDNATVRKFMEEKLAPFGFSTDFAETGEQAVGLTGTKEYTCVFLDVVLPGIDGYQVCKLIKSNKQAIKRTAVVMLTSRSSSFDKLRGSLAGCDEYLTKPVDENHLLEVVARFLPSARAAA
jgi:twitching motility two-component system response regulator PilG